MNRSNYLQTNDWDHIRDLLMADARSKPLSVYCPAVIARFTRTRDVCELVFKERPLRKKKRRKGKAQ